MAKYLLALMLLNTAMAMASEANISFDESEVKEEIARVLNLNAQQFDITPIAVEHKSSGVGLKGRLFITWSVRDIVSSDESLTYSSGMVKLDGSSDLDKAEAGSLVNSVKIGYQVFEHLGVESSFEQSKSMMGISSLSGVPLGSITTSSPANIKNEFQTIKIGLVTNMKLINAKSFRLDLTASASAGLIRLNSAYKNDGDVYKDAFGYSTGAEVGVRAIHKSGVYISSGVGMNKKVLAPKTYANGSSSSFNGNEKHVYVNIGYSFGGKKGRR